MSFDALIQKVKQAEGALETSERRTAARWTELKITWKEGWTPGRIVIAGAALGFMAGRAKPFKLAGSSGLLNLVTTVSGLFASGNAQVAADEASNAADSAAAQVATTPVLDTTQFDASSA